MMMMMMMMMMAMTTIMLLSCGDDEFKSAIRTSKNIGSFVLGKGDHEKMTWTI